MPDSESLNPDNFSKYIYFYLQKKQWISKKTIHGYIIIKRNGIYDINRGI